MTAILNVGATSDMAAARADVEGLGSAVRGLGSDVDAAAGQARSASVNFDALGEGSDNVASKSSQAAAGIGDLAGGLEAVGATGAASALNGVALASSVAAGAGDILNLVAETSVGRWIASTAASVAHRTATIAGTVATGAMTVAQGALNAVMSANPIALVVIALAALAAGVVFAYQKSETFRGIVDGAFSRAKDVIEDAADAVESVIDFIGDLPDKASSAAGTVAGAFTSMFAPIQTAIGWVQDLIDLISNIDFPDLPDIPGVPGLRGAPVEGGAGRGGFIPASSSSPMVHIELKVEGALDKDATARQILDVLRSYLGRVPELGGLSLG